MTDALPFICSQIENNLPGILIGHFIAVRKGTELRYLTLHQCIKFILFWNDTLHVSDGLSVHRQEFETVHTATGICQTDTAVCLLARLI